MPSLTAFGRKWGIAADDFVFPVLWEAFVRCSWLIFASYVFFIHYPLVCKDSSTLLYFSVLIIVNVLTLFMCFVLAWESSRGTIMITRPRRHVSTCLYIRVPFFFVELMWTLILTYLMFGGFDACHHVTLLRITVFLEWSMILGVLLGFFIVFNTSSQDETQDAMLITKRAWTRRLFFLKIHRSEHMREAVDDIANMIASFFVQGDYVFSDIAAGLLLVVHSPVNEYPPLVARDNAVPEWMSLEAAQHFAHYATCVYGWPSYLIQEPGCKSYISLLKSLRCCGTCDRSEVLIIEDNCCLCNTSAFLLSSRKHSMGLFFVSFRNNLYETPFVVLADHKTQNVVITIRGSCSITDLVTDLIMSDEVLSIDVDADPLLRQDESLDSHGQVRVHRGMLRSARYVYELLRKHEVLEDLKILHPNYGLVICGHSLGAGVASLLTLFLKQAHPNVKCYAYAPPGCVISEEGQDEMRQHVMSVVTRDDVVPRISYHSMHRLRAAVVRELATTKKAKCVILFKGVFRLFCKSPWEDSQTESTEQLTDSLVGPSRSSYGSRDVQVILPADTEILVDESRIQLYAPGNIIYLADEDKDSDVIKQWIDPKCLSDIKLSASAVTDHLPHYVNYILEKAVDQSNSQSVDT